MSRLPLIHIPHGIYSVVSKCNNDEFHFNAKEKFEYYLRHILECKKELGFKIYDICCMSNHTHEMYVVPEDVTIATILQRIKGHFSLKFNKKFGRSGHFWRNKPFYRIVEDEQYALNSCYYYHTNPVRAGLVTHPAQWPYSGYRFHVLGERLGIIGELLDPIPGFTAADWQSVATKENQEIANMLGKPRNRFIGSIPFGRRMKRQRNATLYTMNK